MQELTVLAGRGKKRNWAFVVADSGEVIKGFRGGINALMAWVHSKYALAVLGGISGGGDARRRALYVQPYPQVRTGRVLSDDEYDMARGRANAETARTQLRAWK